MFDEYNSGFLSNLKYVSSTSFFLICQSLIEEKIALFLDLWNLKETCLHC